MTKSRLDPSSVAPETLGQLSEALADPNGTALVNAEGRCIDLPEALAGHLARIVRLMAEKRTVAVVPEDEDFTTQAAADFLGMSRQHLVDLLESGEIPFHKVGTHRRVAFRDLLAYQKERDGKRREALSELAQDVSDAGFYDASYTGDSGDTGAKEN